LHDSISATASSIVAHGFAQELRKRRWVESVCCEMTVVGLGLGGITTARITISGFIAGSRKAEVTGWVEITGRIYGDPRGKAKIPPWILFFLILFVLL